MNRKVALLAARFISNPYRDSYVVRLGAKAILLKFGIVGKWAQVLEYPLRLITGFLMETGVYQIDMTLDSIKLYLTKEEARKLLAKTYVQAKKPNMSPEEKEKIRNDYRKALRLIGPILPS